MSNLAAKLVWVFSYLAVYGLRPLVVRPKKPDASDVLCLALVLGFVIFTGVITIVFNLIADLLYGVLDPRIRFD